jgi:NADH:ubiquinone oxidoreductase subunit F (NADH-binding)
MRIESAVGTSDPASLLASFAITHGRDATWVTIEKFEPKYINVVLPMSSLPFYLRDLDRNANLSSTHLRAGYDSSIVPRIIVPDAIVERLTLLAEKQLGTYSTLRCNDVIAELESARLLGRGGAGFPAHVKWRSVAAARGRKVVVANGEEGEPTSLKDRWLLTRRPHLVLEGLLIAAATVGADRAIVYLSHAETVETVRSAIAELESAGLPKSVSRIELHVVPSTYVAGEESAVCRSISGGPALPKAKPPRPFEAGVDGLPTLVSNVETFAHAAWIARNGAGEYLRFGTAASPGTTLITLGGACNYPGVYEVSFGKTINEVFVSLAGGFVTPPRAFAVGGWFGGLISASNADVRCCFSALRSMGSGFGCGAITVLGEFDNPLQYAADVAAWYVTESAQQCGVCVKGTVAISEALTRLKEGRGTNQDRANLSRWGTTLPGRGACALLDGAATLARSTLLFSE